MSNEHCLICKRNNRTLHWHIDNDTGNIWCWCNGKCQRGYSIREYCHLSGVSLSDFLKGDFSFNESTPNEVSRLEWPSHFIPLSDPRAKKGVEYIKGRGLGLQGDMYYDMKREAIVLPYYFQNTFVGAQMRYITPITTEDGDVLKITTMPGTRLGLVFYNWNQEPFITNIKGVIVCEGAFNALAIQQSLNKLYGGVLKNPWKAVACSGSGSTKHHLSKFKELLEAGIKVVCAPDSDEAGLKMLSKFKTAEAVSHYALTMDSSKDWNDILKEQGSEKFSKFFLSTVKSI
jgi:hypothetical protein